MTLHPRALGRRGLRLLARGILLPVDYSFSVRVRVGRVLQRKDPSDYLVDRDPVASSEGGLRQPVVLIPGVYETWHFLRPVAERLAAAGHPVHVVTALRRNTAPIAPSARLVAEHLAEHGLRDVVIVAHSKGGLIGKHLMLLDDPDGRVDRMIAIASPFQGSIWAKYLRIPSLTIFAPDDELVLTLAANLETNARITSIYPSLDAHIPGGSRLEGARNIRLGMAGHFRTLGSPVLLDLVERLVADPDALGEPPERAAAAGLLAAG